MKVAPTVSTGVFLIALCSVPAASLAQTACKSVDDASGVAARRAAVQNLTPEALAQLRELAINPPRGKIVGGVTTLFTDNPWQVALIRSAVPEPTRSQFCGGSIIRDNWILTAGHCVRNSIVREDAARLEVIAGTSQYAAGGERLKVAAIHHAPELQPDHNGQ